MTDEEIEYMKGMMAMTPQQMKQEQLKSCRGLRGMTPEEMLEWKHLYGIKPLGVKNEC